MRKMNISVAKSYTDKNTNAAKTKWINIGSLVISDDGKVFGEIESVPVGITELKFNCFDRDEAGVQTHQQPQQGYAQTPPMAPVGGRATVQYKNAQGQLTDEYGNPLPAHYQQR